MPLHLARASSAPVPAGRSRNANVSITKDGSLPHTNSRVQSFQELVFLLFCIFKLVFLPWERALPPPPYSYALEPGRTHLSLPPHPWLLLCALSAFLPSALCQALGRDPGVVAINLMLAAKFFAAFFFWQYTTILNGNFLHYNLGVAGLCLDAMVLDANSLLGRMVFIVLVLK